MLHRVSYAQILDTLREADEPLYFDELYDLLPCEPDYYVLSAKLDNLVAKGLISVKTVERSELTPSGWISCPNSIWQLANETEDY